MQTLIHGNISFESQIESGLLEFEAEQRNSHDSVGLLQGFFNKHLGLGLSSAAYLSN